MNFIKYDPKYGDTLFVNGTLRVSFDLDNTIDEIDVFSKELSKIVNRIS